MLSNTSSFTVEQVPAATLQPAAAPGWAERRSAPQALGLGWMPALSLIASLGVLLVSAADQVSRRGVLDGQPVYWAGLVVIIAPIVARQCSAAASRTERVALVLVLGLALYLVKVVSSAYAFTFPDEFAQTYNADQLLQTGHLFSPNPLIDITALYVGLPSVAAAISSLTGLGTFQAGIALAAACRLLLMLGVFLLLEQVTASAKLAAIGATLYVANPNFLLYSADFGYETLALPLAVGVLFAAARRGPATTPAEWRSWTVVAGVLILAVVVTHHVTSYALCITLLVASALALALRWRRLDRGRPFWDLALFACCAVAGWLALVASPTLTYLSQVLGPAAIQALAVVRGASPARQLFASGAGPVSPEWQRLTAFASVLLIAAGLGYGLWCLRRRPLWTPFGALLTIAAAAYIPIQALRLTPAAWETANRSSEFLFIGAALVLAIAAGAALRAARAAWIAPIGGLVIILGGIISGSTYVLQIPPPYLVSTSTGQAVEPEGVTDARWTAAVLGPGRIVATDPSNALLMTAYGEQFTYSGQAHGIQGVMLARDVDASVRGVLSTMQVAYVEVDRRLRSQDHSIGLYPPGGIGPLAAPSAVFDPAVYAKFDDQPNVSRIADSGNIVLYDVRALAAEAQP